MAQNISQNISQAQGDCKVQDDGQKQGVQQRSSTSTFPFKKMGYIARKRKHFIDVNAGGEIIEFTSENITKFEPRQFDRVALFFEHQLLEDEEVPKVVKMEPFVSKEISGKITYIEPNENGLIDGTYFFFWDVVNHYEVVNKGDKVTAKIIECELVDENKFSWRCISVTKIESASQSMSNNEHRHKDNVNKNGIEVPDEIVVDFNELHETKEFTIPVRNTSPNVYKVEKSIFKGSKGDSQIELISPTRSASFSLKPNEEKLYVLKATSRYYGDRREQFVITFSSPTKHFKICRFIKISVFDREQVYNTIGTGPNVRDNRDYTQSVDRNRHRNIIPGVPPKRSPNFTKIKFDTWEIPQEIKNLIFEPKTTRSFIKDKLDAGWPFLKEKLNISNYDAVFHTLLYLEEGELFHNIRKYDKFSSFTRENDYLALSIENVAETRPSLVIGKLFIRLN